MMRYQTKFWLWFFVVWIIASLVIFFAETGWPHPGTLDAYGCHSNKALYGTTAKRECHIDLLAGQVFASTTAEYKAYIAAQKTVINGLKTELGDCKAKCDAPAPITSLHASDSASLGLGERAPPRDTTLTLTWDPNTEPDLAGYKAYCGLSPHNYTMVKPIALLPRTAVYQNLPSGTYYCAVTAVDTAGNESGFSNEVSKVIP